MSTQVAQDLRAAAEVLRREGWTQGSYFDGSRCCQAGALLRSLEPGAHRATELSAAAYKRWTAAERALDRHLRGDASPGYAIEWNDNVATSADEVIAALEAAADAAEQVTA